MSRSANAAGAANHSRGFQSAATFISPFDARRRPAPSSNGARLPDAATLPPAMDCQSCHAKKATVHLTEIVGNKEKRELHLCESCAQQQGTTGMEIMGLISSAFGPTGKTGAGAEAVETKCPNCGLAYSD